MDLGDRTYFIFLTGESIPLRQGFSIHFPASILNPTCSIFASAADLHKLPSGFWIGGSESWIPFGLKLNVNRYSLVSTIFTRTKSCHGLIRDWSEKPKSSSSHLNITRAVSFLLFSSDAFPDCVWSAPNTKYVSLGLTIKSLAKQEIES